mgnify:CR=1 FL=1
MESCDYPVSVLFSEPKIPQFHERARSIYVTPRFSALQRAENSSIKNLRNARGKVKKFQCSSASRKFLNSASCWGLVLPQRVSVLFSEPKIPQSKPFGDYAVSLPVSVLFSEPKIPQSS